MKDLFTIQTESGQLWHDIKAHLDAKSIAVASDIEEAVTKARLEIQTNLDALVRAGQAAHAAGDLDALGVVLEQAADYTTDAREAAKEHRRAELEAELKALQ